MWIPISYKRSPLKFIIYWLSVYGRERDVTPAALPAPPGTRLSGRYKSKAQPCFLFKTGRIRSSLPLLKSRISLTPYFIIATLVKPDPDAKAGIFLIPIPRIYTALSKHVRTDHGF